MRSKYCFSLLLLLVPLFFHHQTYASSNNSTLLNNIATIVMEIRNLTNIDRDKISALFRLAGIETLGQALLEQLNGTAAADLQSSMPIISAQCLSDLFYLMKNIKDTAQTDIALSPSASLNPVDQIPWSLRVLDSFGKIPTGFLHGNVWMLGSYDQCVDIVVPKQGEGRFWQGQHCRYVVKLFRYLLQPGHQGYDCHDLLPLKYGACLPASCTVHDAQLLGLIVNKSLGGIACSLDTFCHGANSHEQCQSNSPDAFKLVTAFVGAVATLVIFGTAYDVFIVQPKRNEKVHQHSAARLLNGEEQQGLKVNDNSGPVPDDHSFFSSLLIAFSAYSNARRIFSTAQPSGQITCFHGIRVLSMFWIIFGHTYYWAIRYLNNLVDAYKLPDNVFNQVLLNGSLAVDSFLFLSGSLLAFIWLKKMRRNEALTKSPAFWLQYFFHKYLRVTPVYLIVLIIYATLLPKLSDGPLWENCNFNDDRCELSWWTNVLYVNNFFYLDKACMTWSWYLALDMQYFLLASPLLVLFLKHQVVAVLITTMLICLSAAVQIAYRVVNPNWPPIAIFSINPQQFDIIGIYWKKIYINPCTRCGPFLIGLLFGYYMHKVKMTKKMPKTIVVAGWLIFTGSAVAIIFGLVEYSKHFKIHFMAMLLYAGFGRTIWAIVLAWICFACTTGYGGVVDRFLSWKGWIPLSRLTYCLYLVHPIMIQTFYASQSKPVHFSGHYQMVHYFLGHLFVSIAVAIVVCLAFECPVQILEPSIFGISKKLSKRPKQQQQKLAIDRVDSSNL